MDIDLLKFLLIFAHPCHGSLAVDYMCLDAHLPGCLADCGDVRDCDCTPRYSLSVTDGTPGCFFTHIPASNPFYRPPSVASKRAVCGKWHSPSQRCANSEALRNDAFLFQAILGSSARSHPPTLVRIMSMKALKVQESFDFVGEKSVKEQVCSVAVVHVLSRDSAALHRGRAREARDSVTRAILCRQERAIEKCENLCESLVKIIKTDVLNVETGQRGCLSVCVLCMCSMQSWG